MMVLMCVCVSKLFLELNAQTRSVASLIRACVEQNTFSLTPRCINL